jgi:hypothetical protein
MPCLETLNIALTALPSSLRLWGYLDPGTGSMMFQVLVAGLFSSAFFLRSWVRYLRDGVSMKLRKS